jgi:hypothetical protein
MCAWDIFYTQYPQIGNNIINHMPSKPINVEITMGHDIGLSESYYKPTTKLFNR